MLLSRHIADFALESQQVVADCLQREYQSFLIPNPILRFLHIIVHLADTPLKTLHKPAVDIQGCTFIIAVNTHLCPLSCGQFIIMEHKFISVAAEREFPGIVPIGDECRMV